MIYTFTIRNKQGQPLPGATVLFSNDAGQRITSITADSAGKVQVDSDADSSLFVSGILADFSAPGFNHYSVTTVSLPQNFSVTLEPKVNTGLLLGIGAVAAVLIFTGGKKKNIIGAAESESKKAGLPPWVFPVAVIGGGAAILISFLNKKDPKATDSANILPAADSEISNQAAAGVYPTISSATAESFSATIVQATDDCGTDEQAIYDTFAQLSNTADLWLLIKVFGVREIKSCFGGNYFGNTPYNLPQIISAELSAGERSTLNNILQQKGINYTF